MDFYGTIPQTIMRRKDIRPAAKVLYARLTLYERGGGTWASDAAIADEIGLSERTVRREVAALLDAGLIVRRPGRARVLNVATGGRESGVYGHDGQNILAMGGQSDGADLATHGRDSGAGGHDGQNDLATGGRESGADGHLDWPPTAVNPAYMANAIKEEQTEENYNNNRSVVVVDSLLPKLPPAAREACRPMLEAAVERHGAERVERAVAYCTRRQRDDIQDWQSFIGAELARDHAGQCGWTPPPPPVPAPAASPSLPSGNHISEWMTPEDFAEARRRREAIRAEVRRKRFAAV